MRHTNKVDAILKGMLLAALSSGFGFLALGQWASVAPTVFTRQFVGMGLLSPTRHWPTVPIGAVRPTGTTWGYIEPAKGQYNWSGLDSWVAQANAHGAEFVYVFMNTPQWASSRPNEKCSRGNNGCAAPPNPADWEEFVTAVVTRYQGRIADYEMWNEPNIIGFYTGTPAQMVDMVARASRIIKSVNPHAKIVSPSSSGSGWPTQHDVWLDQYLQAGGGKFTDVIAWHGYPGFDNRAPPPPEVMVQQINQIRAVMAKHGLSNLPIWDTEGSFMKDMFTPDEQQQAAWLTRWYLIQFTHGVARTYWYQWDSPTYGTLWRDPAGTTVAGDALKQVIGWLDGVTASTPCAPVTNGIWTCDLVKGNQRFRAVWSTSAQSTYADTKSFTAYTDMLGVKSKIASQPITVGPLPVLLQVH